MRYKANQFPAKNEDGLVALLVVGIMIILLSLTTVAFTKLMSRESQQSLDRELSSQAYYAAQSGINDAKDYLNTHPGAALTTSNCNTLAVQGYPPYLGPNSTDDVNKVTCVVGDTTPEQLFFPIDSGKSQIFEISSASNISSVLFSWDNASVSGYVPGNYKGAGLKSFDTTAGWNSTGPAAAPVLELAYYPIPNGATALPALSSASRTIYLYPGLRAGVGAPTFNNGGQDASIINSTCHQNNTDLDTPGIFKSAKSVYHCNVIVSPGAVQNMFVKVSAFYSAAFLAVRANDAAGNAIAIRNAQLVLDSTGRGGTDVLKRLQAIVNYRPNDTEPAAAIETVNGLCKRLEYNLTNSQLQVDDPNPDADTSPACHTADL